MSQAVSGPKPSEHPHTKQHSDGASSASGVHAAQRQKEYQREARRTSIVPFFVCNRLYRQEQARQLGRAGTERPLRRPVRNRAQAVKYALFENGHHHETIVELSREIELDMRDTRPFSGLAPLVADAPPRRVA